jgi:DNA-binding transcriptional LysR family regulator
MDSNLLEAFIAVAENESFSAAAELLHCTQSAVSLKIKRLEERMGTPLFERSSRSVTLTESGGTLLAYARQILHLQAEASTAVSAASRGPTLRFGISEEQGECYLPDILPAFTRQCPRARLEVHCAQSFLLSQRLEQGLLDFALVIRDQRTGAGQLMGSEPLVWVAGRDFQLDGTRPLPLALNPEGCVYRARAQHALAAAGRDWSLVFTSQSPVGINAAVAAGLVVTVKAQRSVPADCRVLDSVDGLPELGDVEVVLQRASTALAPEAAVFEQILCATLAACEWLRQVA